MRLQDTSANTSELVLVGDFPDFAPIPLFGSWTQPDRIKEWWAPEAEIEPRQGGAYHLWWPEQNHHLRGTYSDFRPGKALAFTWRWDHEPADAPTRTVILAFDPMPADAGVRLTLRQFPYGDTDAEKEARAGHLEGWTYFLSRLQSLSPATDWTSDKDE